ncbi:hypothetical protein OP10G_4714 [Fimbriimonas ginsengisoli Gsoil 348]|uniref:Uncharacterized protein n=1 Tax=Fimbriimonas ginsengisoli Gsoil 348 TaxID=661478 RepID=A0A068NXN4_FIMGI|nr:hypothetical protein OP10G_4714 [Fimbriimonas ginsengisoli Gsoil 348]
MLHSKYAAVHAWRHPVSTPKVKVQALREVVTGGECYLPMINTKQLSVRNRGE